MFVFCNPCARAELHQQKCAQKLCSATLKPLTWKRYIDNVFSLWHINKEEIDTFIELAHNYYPTIKFTSEISDTEIPFLDSCVYKGERFKKESTLGVRTHFKRIETFQYIHVTSCYLQASGKALSKARPQDF